MSILVPLDASDIARSAVPQAAELARALGEELLLVTVADWGTRQSLVDFADVENEDPIEILEANLRNQARSLHGIEVSTELIPGESPANAIIERARADDVSMVVIATHGRTGISRWRLGSVAERVVRGTTVPVLVVPAPWRMKEKAFAQEEARV